MRHQDRDAESRAEERHREDDVRGAQGDESGPRERLHDVQMEKGEVGDRRRHAETREVRDGLTVHSICPECVRQQEDEQAAETNAEHRDGDRDESVMARERHGQDTRRGELLDHQARAHHEQRGVVTGAGFQG